MAQSTDLTVAKATLVMARSTGRGMARSRLIVMATARAIAGTTAEVLA